MTAHVHPSSSELLAFIHEPGRATPAAEHIGNCLACRVRLSRLREITEPASADDGTFQRIVAASTPLPPNLADLVAPGDGKQPGPNEVWRVGREEALLAWVRRVFEDGVVEVVPLVLDVELADQHSVLIGADATPILTDMAALVALRTHLHPGALINYIGDLNISTEVAEIMTAVQENRRPSGIRVGPPVGSDFDQRLEYRQALRDLLAPLSPSSWPDDSDDDEPAYRDATHQTAQAFAGGDVGSVKTQLTERIDGIRIVDNSGQIVGAGPGARAESVFNVFHIDTTVIVAIITSDGDAAPRPDDAVLARTCDALLAGEPSANAVVIALDAPEWPAWLFSSSHLRTAHQLPNGGIVPPAPTFFDLGLVDALCKYLDGVGPAWQLLEEPASGAIGRSSIHQLATRHAARSIENIAQQGRLARQPAKKGTWTSLPKNLSGRIADFVTAAAADDVEKAINDLLGETSGD